MSCSIISDDELFVTITNSSNDNLVVSFVPCDSSNNITTVEELNRYSVASSKISSKESIKIYLSKQPYYIYYNYSDIWGILTEKGVDKVFSELSGKTISINKQGWVYE